MCWILANQLSNSIKLQQDLAVVLIETPTKNAHKKFECHIIIKLIIKIKKFKAQNGALTFDNSDILNWKFWKGRYITCVMSPDIRTFTCKLEVVCCLLTKIRLWRRTQVMFAFIYCNSKNICCWKLQTRRVLSN